jgi:hypothetical protein
MMQSFWLATWNAAATPVPAGPSAAPLAASRARRLAIEVLQEGERLVVLLSAADQLAAAGTLQCLIGFANSAPDCSLWRSRGFPMVEAAIRQQAGSLEIFTPFFGDQPAMRYGQLLLAVDGVAFDADPPGAGLALAASYAQFQEAPDPARPASFVLRRKVDWRMARSRTRMVPALPLTIRAPQTRSPSLVPLGDGPLAITHAWSGMCEGAPVPTFAAQAATRVPRRDVFGAPAFQFQEVEVIGFRIDLRGKDLNPLIAPLNAHPPGRPPDFRYRVARPVVLIQLLRYGRMQLAGEPQPPLDETDFQSQHELVVRVDTGRVQDGEVELHDPAVHVPAIFVDNPWSKILGRDLQGFEKCLADFSVRAAGGNLLRLQPDGRRFADGAHADLSDIVRVHLVDLVSQAAAPSQHVLLEIEMERLDDGDERARQLRDRRDADPDARDALRDFAEQRVEDGIDGFRSIQATPVDDRGLDKAWISATCELSDRADQKGQAAIAHLRFHVPPGAPRGWVKLCELLGPPVQGKVIRDFQPGEWFRSRFSMDLTVHDE